MLLGGGNLVPWMTFLALPDYFFTLYASNAMEFLFPTVSTTALVLASVAMLALGPRLSFAVRIGWASIRVPS